MNRLPVVLLFAIALLLSPPLRAHGLDVGQIGLQLEGDRLLLVATPPARAFAAFDRDGDGRLAATELQQQREAIALELDRMLVLRDGAGRMPALTLSDVVVPAQGKDVVPGPATHVKIIRRYRFTTVPGVVQLDTDLAVRSGAPVMVLLQADGQPLQSAALTPRQDKVRFALGTATGWETFRQWLAVGIEHILLGIDHLVFLLLLVWGAVRIRSAALWLTAFTVGHSLTLLLVMLGVLIFPVWAEAAIAATIVVTGLQCLYRSRRTAPLLAGRVATPSPAAGGADAWHAPLALLFGLVHGMGFAGAVSTTALVTEQRWSTLAGFNLGIEAGQVLVVLLLWPLLARLRGASAWLAQGLLGGATGLGFFWLVERL
ncbi:MAG: HupE/UreJ family protein [Moraxellaceae bacterium]|jgi:hypothetical protein|nr:HupE/UreJ family protein [Moraxellaceae bacterium]